MFRQLTIRDRVILQYQIEHQSNCSCASISQNLNCHPASIYRELKRNGIQLPCKAKNFPHTTIPICKKLLGFPFVCNRCFHFSTCSIQRIAYDAYEADSTARHRLKSMRSHPHMSKEQLQELDRKVSERVRAHQSLYHIMTTDPSITQSESTLRRYIDKRYLSCQNIDLPRTIRFPYQKELRQTPRKRINIEFLVNRTYQDYLDYTATKPRVVLQLDTMIGKRNDSKVLLTLYEPQSKFQWGVLIHRTATSVNQVIQTLIETLLNQNHLFFDCLLTDNGAEFQSLPLVENDSNGIIRCRVFYCDPYASYQKGGCERNHSLARYLIKKGESLDFVFQDEINELFSHINSQRRKSLKGLSPFQRFIELFHFTPSEFIPIFEIDPKLIKLK